MIVPATRLRPVLELRPPPRACAGGVSTVVPSTVTGLPLTVTTELPELSTRSCAWLLTTVGELSVVIWMTRNRRRVIVVAVLLVTERRMVIVPSVQFDGATPPLQTLGVVSRSRLGDAEAATLGLSRAFWSELRMVGDARFSGPGAPSVETRVLNVPPVVETKSKSAWLLSVSTGSPPVEFGARRTKLYSPLVEMPPAGASAVPSVKSVVPVMPAKPTASKRVLVPHAAVEVVLKTAAPPPAATPVAYVWSPA